MRNYSESGRLMKDANPRNPTTPLIHDT